MGYGMVMGVEICPVLFCSLEGCPAVGKPMQDWGIEDPSSRGIGEYRKTREIIGRKVEELLEVLTSESSQ